MLFIKDREKWDPVRVLGRDATLSSVEREILDGISVIEQKADFAKDVSIRNHNILVVLIMILIVTNGPAMLKVIQGWIAPTAATTAATK